jgi:hypothetical protein
MTSKSDSSALSKENAGSSPKFPYLFAIQRAFADFMSMGHGGLA